ncbi:metallophosphoesterase family protein [Patulibacter minatonensis]|uniref:metallophosphoesterase family protein n=1 Tax=Patulibacter minatonensis TaxID=298163 RepID=UPI0006879471|nr:DNA repair exonuclease [Patulibacter minatonensis]
MPSFRFLHAADLHLDTPFAGLGRVAPHVGRALQDASLQAWDGLVQLALDEDVAFVVLAGDLYDGAERGLRAQLRVRDGLRRLSEAGIETFVVHGNHDPLEEGWQAIAADGWPDGVTVCPAGDVTTREVVRDGARVATLHGVSYARAATTANLARRFPAASGGGFHVGVLHATVGTQPDHSPYAPCTLDDLRAPGYGYWALGHVHGFQVLATDPHVVYSGSLQGRSPKPAERGAKGAVVVGVVDDQVHEVRHVPLDAFRFEEVDIDVSRVPDVASVVDALRRAGDDAAAGNGDLGLVLRATLTGTPGAGHDLRRDGAVDELLAALRDADETARPLRWWDRVADRTVARIDRDALAGQESFVGALVRHVDDLAGAPPAPGLPTGWLQALDDDLAGRIRGRGTAYEPDVAVELRDAEALALSLLTAEEASS